MALAVGAVTHLRPRCPTDFPSSAMKNLRPAQSQLSADLHSRRLLPCLFYTSRRSPRLFTFSAAAVSVEKTEKDQFPISVTETKQPRSSVSLGIEVPPTICTESYNKVLHEFSKQAKVPGFRPGKKVPENILINFVGKNNIQQAVIEAILKKTLPQAMKLVEGRALKDSVRIVTKFSDMYDTFSPKEYFS